jgi:hypothetical protein
VYFLNTNKYGKREGIWKKSGEMEGKGIKICSRSSYAILSYI